ncbi:hypothetical protein FHG87_018097 [Trinorchestia longiramus]|nr:hypothetical protein FHG87_018097 [Trinorchestia longiramus]
MSFTERSKSSGSERSHHRDRSPLSSPSSQNHTSSCQSVPLTSAAGPSHPSLTSVDVNTSSTPLTAHDVAAKLDNRSLNSTATTAPQLTVTSTCSNATPGRSPPTSSSGTFLPSTDFFTSRTSSHSASNLVRSSASTPSSASMISSALSSNTVTSSGVTSAASTSSSQGCVEHSSGLASVMVDRNSFISVTEASRQQPCPRDDSTISVSSTSALREQKSDSCSSPSLPSTSVSCITNGNVCGSIPLNLQQQKKSSSHFVTTSSVSLQYSVAPHTSSADMLSAPPVMPSAPPTLPFSSQSMAQPMSLTSTLNTQLMPLPLNTTSLSSTSTVPVFLPHSLLSLPQSSLATPALSVSQQGLPTSSSTTLISGLPNTTLAKPLYSQSLPGQPVPLLSQPLPLTSLSMSTQAVNSYISCSSLPPLPTSVAQATAAAVTSQPLSLVASEAPVFSSQPISFTSSALPFTTHSLSLTSHSLPLTSNSLSLGSHHSLPLTTNSLPFSSQTLPFTTQTLPLSTQTFSLISQALPLNGQTRPLSGNSLPMSTRILPTATQTLSVASPAQPVPSKTLALSSEGVPISSQALLFTNQTIPLTTHNLPLTSQSLLLTSQTLPLSTQPLPFTTVALSFATQAPSFITQALTLSGHSDTSLHSQLAGRVNNSAQQTTSLLSSQASRNLALSVAAPTQSVMPRSSVANSTVPLVPFQTGISNVGVSSVSGLPNSSIASSITGIHTPVSTYPYLSSCVAHSNFLGKPIAHTSGSVNLVSSITHPVASCSEVTSVSASVFVPGIGNSAECPVVLSSGGPIGFISSSNNDCPNSIGLDGREILGQERTPQFLNTSTAAVCSAVFGGVATTALHNLASGSSVSLAKDTKVSTPIIVRPFETSPRVSSHPVLPSTVSSTLSNQINSIYAVGNQVIPGSTSTSTDNHAQIYSSKESVLVKLEPGSSDCKPETLFNVSASTHSLTLASMDSGLPILNNSKSTVSSVWSTPLPGSIQCKVEPMLVDSPTLQGTFSYPTLGLNIHDSTAVTSSSISTLEQKLAVPKSEPNSSFCVSNLVSPAIGDNNVSVNYQVICDKNPDPSNSFFVKTGVPSLHSTRMDIKLPLTTTSSTVCLQYPHIPSTVTDHSGLAASSATVVPNGSSLLKSSKIASSVLSSSLHTSITSATPSQFESIVSVYSPRSIASAIPFVSSSSASGVPVTNVVQTSVGIASGSIACLYQGDSLAGKHPVLSLNLNSIPPQFAASEANAVGSLGLVNNSIGVTHNPLLLHADGLLSSSLTGVQSGGLGTQQKITFSPQSFPTLVGSIGTASGSLSLPPANQSPVIVGSATQQVLPNPSSQLTSMCATSSQHTPVPHNAPSLEQSTLTSMPISILQSTPYMVGTQTMKPLISPCGNQLPLSVPTTGAGVMLGSTTYVQLVPPRVPTPEVPRSPVSLLDLRAKQEAEQKVQERLECKKQEAQCKKLREALKALEEAHLEQQQQALQESIIKEEANVKREIKSEVTRSRKEEIRIRKEEEKAAREEAKNRKEEARQKREEGMRVIRSELKRKMLEERQGSIVKKRVTLLHKGPPAPLDTSRGKLAIFECVGLVTHDTAGEVLYGNCERRVRVLHPLLTPPTSPSPPLTLTNSGEQLALAVAPKNISQKRLLEQPHDLLKKTAFFQEIGLKKQHPSDAQNLEFQYKMVIEERLRRYSSSKVQDSFIEAQCAALQSRMCEHNCPRETHFALAGATVINVTGSSNCDSKNGLPLKLFSNNSSLRNQSIASGIVPPPGIQGSIMVNHPERADRQALLGASHPRVPFQSCLQAGSVKQGAMIDSKNPTHLLQVPENLLAKIALLPPQQQLQVQMQLLNQQQLSGLSELAIPQHSSSFASAGTDGVRLPNHSQSEPKNSVRPQEKTTPAENSHYAAVDGSQHKPVLMNTDDQGVSMRFLENSLQNRHSSSSLPNTSSTCSLSTSSASTLIVPQLVPSSSDATGSKNVPHVETKMTFAFNTMAGTTTATGTREESILSVGQPSNSASSSEGVTGINGTVLPQALSAAGQLAVPHATVGDALLLPPEADPLLASLQGLDRIVEQFLSAAALGASSHCGGEQHMRELVSVCSHCGGEQHMRELVSVCSHCGGEQHMRELVSVCSHCGGEQHMRELVAVCSHCGGEQHMRELVSVCSHCGGEQHMRELVSVCSHCGGEQHMRELVSVCSHCGGELHMRELVSVCSHCGGVGSSSVLAGHVAAVRRSQAAVISTTQLVQEQVQQLVLTRQQLDAHRLTLHQHLQALTALFSCEASKGKLPNTSGPGTAHRDLPPAAADLTLGGAAAGGVHEASPPGAVLPCVTEACQEMRSSEQLQHANNALQVSATLSNISSACTSLPVNSLLENGCPIQPNFIIKSHAPEQMGNHLTKTKNECVKNLLITSKPNSSLPQPASFLGNPVQTSSVLAASETGAFSPSIKREKDPVITPEFLVSAHDKVSYIDVKGTLVLGRPNNFNARPAHNGAVGQDKGRASHLHTVSASSHSSVSSVPASVYSHALNVAAHSAPTTALVSVSSPADTVHALPKQGISSDSLLAEDGSNVSQNTVICVGKPMLGGNVALEPPTNIEGPRSGSHLMSVTPASAVSGKNSTTGLVASTQTNLFRPVESLYLDNSPAKRAAHSFDAVNLINGTKTGSHLRPSSAMTLVAPGAVNNPTMKPSSPHATVTLPTSINDGSLMNPVSLAGQPRPSSLPGNMLLSVGAGLACTSAARLPPINSSLSTSSLLSRSAPSLASSQPTASVVSNMVVSVATTLATHTTLYNSTLLKCNYIPATTPVTRKTYAPNPLLQTVSTNSSPAMPAHHNHVSLPIPNKLTASPGSNLSNAFAIDQVMRSSPKSPVNTTAINSNTKNQFVTNTGVIVSASSSTHGTLNLSATTPILRPEIAPCLPDSLSASSSWAKSQYVVTSPTDLSKPYYSSHHIIPSSKESASAKPENLIHKSNMGRVVHGIPPSKSTSSSSKDSGNSKSPLAKRSSSNSVVPSLMHGRSIGANNGAVAPMPTSLASTQQISSVYGKKLCQATHKINGTGGTVPSGSKPVGGSLGSPAYKPVSKNVLVTGQQAQVRVSNLVNQSKHHKRSDQRPPSSSMNSAPLTHMSTTSVPKQGQLKAMQPGGKVDHVSPGKISKTSHKSGVAFTPYVSGKSPASKVQPWSSHS